MAPRSPEGLSGFDETTMLPSETFKAAEMLAHWSRYDTGAARDRFNMDLDELIVILSAAHTVGHSKVHKSSPTSLGMSSSRLPLSLSFARQASTALSCGSLAIEQ